MSSLFTSESVTEGHPDKVADAIADAVVDDMMRQDPASHTAIEVLISNGVAIVAGEATTESYVDIADVARACMLDIGYDSFDKGLDGATCGVMVALNNQSPDIAGGVANSWEMRSGSAVDEADQQGAGDQGLMFGYACTETPELMPMPIHMAHRLSERLSEVRRSGVLDHLGPDGKTQVTIDYDGITPAAVTNIVVSTQHAEGVDLDTVLAPEIRREVIAPVLAEYEVVADAVQVLVNPSGRFVIGGPQGDAGVTGRKIIVDTYGGMARHGGGAFSGKDPSKVDRSAAYALRWVAKNIVAAGLATRCEVQVSYAIGRAHPTSLHVDSFGTGAVPDTQLVDAVQQVFDLRPSSIIRDLDLLRPIYSRFTNHGHFGREIPEAAWERTDRTDALAAAVRG
ncbi:methionine adenosyltransferase [Propionibacterium australiense]|uniref:S-adenosylmethionine synthase n=1 Tax=Propionibacterium australiense TaxID=119981 RepID=A0A383S4G5_9ACTN|nr:methionine adenosyltransferase [Propionibacterium australiense]RLP11547.1 methionine adenosyltransferase [Propionibacterium australiense]RLP12719.1 methionine adenosyltransferase [Propionibacterium australiense]SYZ32259.1 methionine adenosyltransferase [Propionibacterium australiense]VEH90567.1 S-adenosylmethionine synthase [Propionibacterium australiense]